MKTIALFAVALAGCHVSSRGTTPIRIEAKSSQYTCSDLGRDVAAYPSEESEAASPRVFSCHDGKCCTTDVLHVTPMVEEMIAVEGSWESAMLNPHDSNGQMIQLGILFRVGEQEVEQGVKVTLFKFTYPSFMALENGGTFTAFITTSSNSRDAAPDGRLLLRGSGCRDVRIILAPSTPIPLRPSEPSQPAQQI